MREVGWETVAVSGAAAARHKGMATHRMCQIHGARSLTFSGEATRPACTVKSPDFSVSKKNRDFTKPGVFGSVVVWPNLDLSYETQPGEHLPGEHFRHITGSGVSLLGSFCSMPAGFSASLALFLPP